MNKKNKKRSKRDCGSGSRGIKSGASPSGRTGPKSPSASPPDLAAVQTTLEGVLTVWNAIRPHLPTPLSEAQRDEMARLTVLIAQEEASLKTLDGEIAALNAKINGNQEYLTHA